MYRIVRLNAALRRGMLLSKTATYTCKEGVIGPHVHASCTPNASWERLLQAPISWRPKAWRDCIIASNHAWQGFCQPFWSCNIESFSANSTACHWEADLLVGIMSWLCLARSGSFTACCAKVQSYRPSKVQGGIMRSCVDILLDSKRTLEHSDSHEMPASRRMSHTNKQNGGATGHACLMGNHHSCTQSPVLALSALNCLNPADSLRMLLLLAAFQCSGRLP